MQHRLRIIRQRVTEAESIRDPLAVGGDHRVVDRTPAGVVVDGQYLLGRGRLGVRRERGAERDQSYGTKERHAGHVGSAGELFDGAPMGKAIASDAV